MSNKHESSNHFSPFEIPPPAITATKKQVKTTMYCTMHIH